MFWKPLTLLVLIALTGCGGGSTSEAGTATSSTGATSASDKPKPRIAPAGAVVYPAAKATGLIKGTVSLDGNAPEMKTIDISGAPQCAALHKVPLRKEEIVVKDGKLANAVVYVTSVDGKAIEDVWTFSAPTAPVVLDQKDCTYHPHVLAIQVDQTVNIVSSDDLVHNVHYSGANKESNDSFQKVNDSKPKTFSEKELGGAFVCNVHGWMKAFVNVFPHPFFAVSADDGTYTLPKLPPGEYAVNVWHESANDSGKLVPVDAVSVKVGDNAITVQDFKLKVK